MNPEMFCFCLYFARILISQVFPILYFWPSFNIEGKSGKEIVGKSFVDPRLRTFLESSHRDSQEACFFGEVHN